MPSKKTAPKKTGKPVAAASKPVVKKSSPVKKSVPVAKAATAKNVVPAKKAAPAKKTDPVAKATPVKKAAPSKKAAPAQKQIVTKEKPVAKTVVSKKPEPPKKVEQSKKIVAAKPAAKVVAPVTVKAVPVKTEATVKSKIPEKSVAKSVPVPVSKPVAAPAPVAPAPKAKPVVAAKAPPAPPVKPVKKQPEPIKDVKLPKLNAKTSVAYKPHYTPLEKREEPLTHSNQTIVKYSDSDLTDFRDLIGKKLEAAKKELAYLQGLITRKDEMGGDNDDSRYMTMEDGSMSMEREQLSQMASRQITYIDHLEKAIMRIENKTYGICRVTGKLIDKARLRAVPHATLSLEAKLGLVKHNGHD
jgi:RNA polymerase-binding transcription factor DksA